MDFNNLVNLCAALHVLSYYFICGILCGKSIVLMLLIIHILYIAYS